MADARKDEPMVVLSTVPTVEVGETIAHALVAEGLAACVNIVPGVTSVYRWEGRIERESELLLVIKTRRERLPDLRRRLIEQHPYDVPEVIAVSVTDGDPAYLAWLDGALRG